VGARDFRLYLAGQAVSVFGSSLTALACSIVAVTTLHAGPVGVAIVIVGGNLPALVGPFLGTMMDRVARPRRILVGTDLVAAAAVCSCAVGDLLGVLDIAMLFGVAMLLGVIMLTIQAVYFPHLSSLHVTDLPAARGRLQSGAYLAGLAGGVCGAPLAGAVSVPLLFCIDTATYLVSAGCLLLLRSPDRRTNEIASRTGLRVEFTAGLRAVHGQPMLVAYLACTAVATLAVNAVAAQRAVYVLNVLRVPVVYYGLPAVVAALLGTLGSLMAPVALRRVGPWRLLVASLALGTLATVALPAATGPLLVELLAVAVAVAIPAGTGAVGNLALVTVICDEIGAEFFGRIATLLPSVAAVTGTIGTVLGGVAGAEWGVRSGIWAGTGMGFLAAAALVTVFLYRGAAMSIADGDNSWHATPTQCQ
jgi:hypothetical protein